MTDFSHLNAIQLRLSHERVRLENAKNDREREFYALQVSQAEKELAGEYKFLGIAEPVVTELNGEELLAELAELEEVLGL